MPPPHLGSRLAMVKHHELADRWESVCIAHLPPPGNRPAVITGAPCLAVRIAGSFCLVLLPGPWAVMLGTIGDHKNCEKSGMELFAYLGDRLAVLIMGGTMPGREKLPVPLSTTGEGASLAVRPPVP